MTSPILHWIAPGNPGFETTLQWIVDTIRTWNPVVRRAAETIVLDQLHDRSTWSRRMAAEVLYRWVQDHMVYVIDAPGFHRGEVVEDHVQAPADMLAIIKSRGWVMGDCDDYVTLLGALAYSLGIEVELVLVSSRPDEVWDHIYMTLNGVPADAIGWETPEGWHHPPLGWEIPTEGVTASRVVKV